MNGSLMAVPPVIRGKQEFLASNRLWDESTRPLQASLYIKISRILKGREEILQTNSSFRQNRPATRFGVNRLEPRFSSQDRLRFENPLERLYPRRPEFDNGRSSLLTMIAEAYYRVNSSVAVRRKGACLDLDGVRGAGEYLLRFARLSNSFLLISLEEPLRNSGASKSAPRINARRGTWTLDELLLRLRLRELAELPTSSLGEIMDDIGAKVRHAA